jgi:hypothetical protein
LEVNNLPETQKLEKVVKEIGTGPCAACITPNVMEEAEKLLLDKGYSAAEIYAAQLSGVDEQNDLARALDICHKEGLSPEGAAKIVKSLAAIRSGKW